MNLKLFAAAAVVLLLLVSVSFVLGMDDEEETSDTELKGTWYQVANSSYDQNSFYSTTVKESYSIEIRNVGSAEGSDAKMFSGRISNVDMCGVYIDDMLIFDYIDSGFGQNGRVFAIGQFEKDKLIMYESHYYSADSWFLSMSVYSKIDKRINYDFPSEYPKISKVWKEKVGESMNSDTQVDLSGQDFVIHNQKSLFFRAEMEQTVGDTMVTKIMNGMFIGDSEDTHIAYLIDETGLMWVMRLMDMGTADPTDDVLIMSSVLKSETSELAGKAVSVERIYFSGPSPFAFPTMEMKGTVWEALSIITTDPSGNIDAADSDFAISYTKQSSSGIIFAGTSVRDGIKASEVGSINLNPFDDSGFILWLGSQKASEMDEPIDRGYAVMSGGKMRIISFWTDDDGNNRASLETMALKK